MINRTLLVKLNKLSVMGIYGYMNVLMFGDFFNEMCYRSFLF